MEKDGATTGDVLVLMDELLKETAAYVEKVLISWIYYFTIDCKKFISAKILTSSIY
jgi:hypothetical protein